MSKTSSVAKQRYNSKTYDHINISVRKEIAAEFRRCVAMNGDTIAGILRDAILIYIQNSASTDANAAPKE
jgi:hypothetical protein